MIDKSEKFRWLVRLGYFSRAVLYMLLGVIALTSRGQIEEGPQAAFQKVHEFPAGVALLWVLAVGLVGYALFRLASTFFDIENNGTDKKGIVKRAGHAGSAIGHLLLAYSAYKIATGVGSGGGDRAQEVAAGVLSVDLGGIVLGLVGLTFAVAAVMQIKAGITGSFMERVSHEAPPYTRVVGGIGFVTRGVVFGIIAWSLLRSGWFSNSSEVKTIGKAVASLSDNGILFDAVAVGLLLFGVFSLVLARCRIVPDLR